MNGLIFFQKLLCVYEIGATPNVKFDQMKTAPIRACVLDAAA